MTGSDPVIEGLSAEVRALRARLNVLTEELGSARAEVLRLKTRYEPAHRPNYIAGAGGADDAPSNVCVGCGALRKDHPSV